jgi:hypothetical protein
MCQSHESVIFTNEKIMAAELFCFLLNKKKGPGPFLNRIER